MIPSHVDVKHLKALTVVLERAKKCAGQLGQRNIWYSGNPCNHPSKFLEELKVLKAHKETLLRLCKSLQKRILILQTPCNDITRQAGIKTLPSEVLSQIFIFSYVGSRDNQQAIHLSHVCRQFRSIALQTPALWTHLHNERPLPETEEFLRRSGSSPLTTTCSTGLMYWPELFAEFLANISSHSLRWSEVELRLEDARLITDNDERENGLAHYRPNLPLPNLTSIHHTYSDDFFHSQWEPWFDTPWLLPALRSYTAVNFMPKSDILSGRITRFSVSWERSYLLDDLSYINLVSFIHILDEVKTLQHLSFSFIDIPFESQHNDLPTATLPNVTTFVLMAKGGPEVEHSIDSLLSNLKLPNLENMSWSVVVTNALGHDLPSMLGWLIPSAKLRRLHLEDHSRLPHALETIIRRCTSLVDLTLCIPNADLFSKTYRNRGWGDTFARRFPLQILTLKDCDAVTRDELQYLLDTLRRGPNWDTFRRLEVNCCKRLSEDFLLAIEDRADGKLKWTTPF
ncbi:hypothetical protein BD410DRAFT_841981 [Rickenella mellea]|uniref:F-box domain-containing protein n=1 Tax=Rickenella mellea TaxID=50990 RepID=A0A4Y7PW59_9AGAM|nr:hypothetical protein BD410DRAFT_841981 [Rickenella mellea]